MVHRNTILRYQPSSLHSGGSEVVKLEACQREERYIVLCRGHGSWLHECAIICGPSHCMLWSLPRAFQRKHCRLEYVVSMNNNSHVLLPLYFDANASTRVQYLANV